jgi:hypothetical protein
MDEFDQTTHSFIIKVWRERTSLKERRFSWRGQITHVPDGERGAVCRIGEIDLFIARYLRQMEVRLGPGYRLLRLAHALRARLRSNRSGRR